MCILCHYYGDGVLVTRERREAEHSDRRWQCMREITYGRYICVDCQLVGPINHTCTSPRVYDSKKAAHSSSKNRR